MNKLFSALRKIAVLLVGIPIVIVGIILIPLPGPGLLITFAGLFIISLEFEWAKKYVDKISGILKDIINKSRPKPGK